MLSKIQISVLVSVVAIVWAATYLSRGGSLELLQIISFGSVVAITPLVLLVFDRWAWKWAILRHWLVKRPIIDGTWRASLKSDYTTPEQPDGVEVDAIFVMRQRYSDISVRLYTAESSSSSIARSIVEIDNEMFELSYTYQNDPKSHLRGDRSEIHYGAAVIRFTGAKPTTSEGEYWTDRLTRGAITLFEKAPSHANGFATGQELFKS